MNGVEPPSVPDDRDAPGRDLRRGLRAHRGIGRRSRRRAAVRRDRGHRRPERHRVPGHHDRTGAPSSRTWTPGAYTADDLGHRVRRTVERGVGDADRHRHHRCDDVGRVPVRRRPPTSRSISTAWNGYPPAATVPMTIANAHIVPAGTSTRTRARAPRGASPDCSRGPTATASSPAAVPMPTRSGSRRRGFPTARRRPRRPRSRPSPGGTSPASVDMPEVEVEPSGTGSDLEPVAGRDRRGRPRRR